jgi:hypothetical protein
VPVFACFSRRLFAMQVLVLLLAWPGVADAGWFVSNNQVAYQLSRRGHDHQALHYWDGSATGWYGRGTALLHLGRLRQAEHAFRQSLALAPHKTGFSDNLAMPLVSRPGFMASVWYNLGNALYAQGKLVQARQAWLAAVRYQPGHAKARHNLEIVNRLLNERQRQERQQLAGLTAAKQKKPGQGGKQASGGAQHRKQQAMHHLPFQLPNLSRKSDASQGSKGGKKTGNAHITSMAERQMLQHPTSPQTHRTAGHRTRASMPKAGGGHRGVRPEHGKRMSSRQAVKELRMVEDGVSLFLRHRLGGKSSQSATPPGGDAW